MTNIQINTHEKEDKMDRVEKVCFAQGHKRHAIAHFEVVTSCFYVQRVCIHSTQGDHLRSVLMGTCVLYASLHKQRTYFSKELLHTAEKICLIDIPRISLMELIHV